MSGAALTISESRELTRLEGLIEAGLETFQQVGEALLKIRDDELYRNTAKT